MTKEEREYYEKKYSHLNLCFAHGKGWDKLTLIAAIELDTLWPDWMSNWFKRLNNRLLYANKGKSLVKVTKFYHSRFRKVLPFIQSYPRFFQIKEKFGGLRLYGASSLENVLEDMSYKICEYCGSTKDIGYTKGWIKTQCKECALKKDKELINWKQYET